MTQHPFYVQAIRIYFFIVLSFFAISLVTIQGIVTNNKTNRLIEGASFTFTLPNAYAITDANGNFIFKGK